MTFGHAAASWPTFDKEGNPTCPKRPRKGEGSLRSRPKVESSHQGLELKSQSATAQDKMKESLEVAQVGKRVLEKELEHLKKVCEDLKTSANDDKQRGISLQKINDNLYKIREDLQKENERLKTELQSEAEKKELDSSITEKRLRQRVSFLGSLLAAEKKEKDKLAKSTEEIEQKLSDMETQLDLQKKNNEEKARHTT